MDQFSISQLARFSGIKAHTIRIWEQRYNALQPDRTEGNTRFYNDSQLRRLLNITALLDHGYKVSVLCEMPDKKLSQLVADELVKPRDEPRAEYFISQLISAGVSYNELHFDKIFSNCLVSMGLRDAYAKVIYPMLDRIGMLWASENIIPASEHFISNLIRQKIFSAIDALPPAKKTAGWVLLLPQGEYHELGLLVANYLLRQAGYPVVYLGPDVPLMSLQDVSSKVRPSNLLTFIVHREDAEVLAEILKGFESAFKGNIYVACSAGEAEKLKTGKRVKLINSISDLERSFS